MKKILSILILVCFVLTNVCSNVFSNISDGFYYRNFIENSNDLVLKKDLLSQYAQIEDSIYKENTPLVILINDLHNNPTVQKNIENIISFIRNNSKIDKIFLEGFPNKKISQNLVSSIQNKDFVTKIADNMLDNSLISGAETFVIKNNFNDLYGIEDWNIYYDNVDRNLSLTDKYRDNITKLRNSFTKNIIYFDKPKSFSLFSNENPFDKRIVEIYNFCKQNNIDLSMYSQVIKFLILNRYENNKNIKEDFRSLLQDIRQKVPYKTYVYINELLKNINSKETINLFFNILKNNFPELLLKYDLLLSFFYNIHSKSEINFVLLLQQVQVLEDYILDNFIEYNQKEIILIDRFINLLSEYVNLSLSYDQYKYFENNKENLYQISNKYLSLDSVRLINDILKDEDLKQYYVINEQRNNIFLNNISKFIDLKENISIFNSSKSIIENLREFSSVNIVVVGGFHTQFIDMLKKSNVSLLNLVPVVTKLSDFDNKIPKKNDIIYNNALPRPSALLRADIYDIAIILNTYLSLMQDSNLPQSKQKEFVEQWLLNNNINVKFKMMGDTVLLNDIPIKQILKEYKKTQETKNEKKHSKLWNIIWLLHKPYAIVKNFLFKQFNFVKQFFNNLNAIGNISSLSSRYIQQNILTDRIVNNEYKLIVNSLEGKMPDVIVLSVSNEEDISFCEKVLSDIKKHPNFKNTHLEYVIKDKDGTGSGITKAIQYLNKTDFDKDVSKLTSVIIDIDTNEKNNIGRTDLPMQFNGRNITPLEIAVLNGIRSCNSFKEKGGIAIIDPQSIYIGNMQVTGDITFVSSAINMKEVQNHKQSLVIKDYPNELQQIYYGFEPENIYDIVEKKGVENKSFYDFDNDSIRQFEVVTGNILISFNDESKYKNFFDFMSDLADYLQLSPRKMNLFQDIFVPLLRLKHKEKIQSYFAKIISETKSFEDRQFFVGLVDKINEYYDKTDSLQDTNFGLYHQSKSLYSRNFTKQLLEKLSDIFNKKQIEIKESNKKTKIIKKDINITESFDDDTALSKAYQMLSELQDKQIYDSTDYEQVYATIKEILRITPMQKNLYTIENKKTAKLYRYISDFISNTILQINEDKTKNTTNKESIVNLRIDFLEMQNYVIEYLRFLDYSANIAILGKYIFQKNSFFEKFKIMPFVRTLLGMNRGVKKAKEASKKQLITLFSSGNSLIGSLYSFDILKEDLDSFIESIENPSQFTSVGMKKQWENTRATQNFLSLAITFQSLVNTIIYTMSTSSLGFSILWPIIGFLSTGLGLSVFLHRISIFIGWRDTFFDNKKKEIDSELQSLNLTKESIETFKYDKTIVTKLIKVLNNILKSKNLSSENKQVIKETIILLQIYSKSYDFNLIEKILKNISILNDNVLLKKELDSFVNYFNRNLNFEYDRRQISDLNKEKTNSEKQTEQYLTNWLNILETDNIDKVSVDNIIGNATKIIEQTVFNENVLKGTNKEIIISQLQDFLSFYNRTILNFKTLSKEKKKELNPEIQILEKMGEYALKYYKALNYLSSLEILYGYRISKDNKLYFLEKIGFMPLIRVLFGIQAGIFFSKKGFINSMVKVKEIGNEIINGLYDDDVEKISNAFFKEQEESKYLYLGVMESWKNRKMLSRSLPLLIFFYNTVTSLVSNSFSSESFLKSFFTGIGLAIFLHWAPIIFGFLKTLTISKKKIKTKKMERFSIEKNRQILLKKHIDNLSKVPYGKMPDLIILTFSKRINTQELKNSINNIRKDGNLKSVPIEIVTTENYGNGNTMLDVFDFVQSDSFVRDYPLLSNKQLKDLKLAIVNIDEEDFSAATKSIGIEISNKEITAIELALLNAIGMIQQNNNKNGNIVVADSSYLYVGDLVQTSNISLLSSNVTYEQLKSQDMPLLISNQLEVSKEGNSQLRKLYYNFNYNKISNIAVTYMLNQMYNTKKENIVQMPTFSGILGINFDKDVDFDLFVSFMNIAKQYVQDYNGRKFKIDFIQHLLIPLTRLMNREDIFVYLESLLFSLPELSSEIKDDYDKFFYGLFMQFDKEFNDKIKSSFINITTSQNSIVTRINKGNVFYRSFISFVDFLKHFDVKQVAFDIRDRLKNFVSYKKQFGLLILPELSNFSKSQIFAFDNEETNNITVTSFEQLSENKKDSGVIINVPVENITIPSKVFYDTITDNKGKSYVVVAFLPVLFDDIDMYASSKETDFLSSILSDDKEEINGIRKNLFIGRATLAFIQELKTNNNLQIIYENSDFSADNIDPAYIVSFDDSGIFCVPEMINDRFLADKSIKNIKHINVSTTNNESVRIPKSYLSKIQLSSLIEEYNVVDNKEINLSLLFKLISNYNFSFDEFDISLFLNDPKKYAKNILDSVFDTKIEMKDYSNIKILPSIDFKFYSIQYMQQLIYDLKIDKIILKNVFYTGTELFDINSLNIGLEIERLNNTELNKLNNLLDQNDNLSNNKIFVLNRLLQYIKTQEKENNLFQQFINNNTEEFKKNLEFFTARQILKKKIVSLSDIENLKNNNTDRWNYYYELNMYIQYVLYTNYCNMANLLQQKDVQIVIDLDLSAMSLKETIEQIKYINKQYGIVNFKLNGEPLENIDKKEIVETLRVNIRNDVSLIFDFKPEGMDTDIYQNVIFISNDEEEIQNKNIKTINPDLSSIDNVNDFLRKLSEQDMLTVVLFDLTNIVNNVPLSQKFNSIINLIKNAESFNYFNYGKTLSEKYKNDIISNTLDGSIGIIDVSNIDFIDDRDIFSYVYQILYDANINEKNYKNLFELISKLKLQFQFQYSNKIKKEKIAQELKGILINISEMQQSTDRNLMNTDVDIQQINYLLSCA